MSKTKKARKGIQTPRPQQKKKKKGMTTSK